jgi:hypothetical protein
MRQLAAAVAAERPADADRIQGWLARWYPGDAHLLANRSSLQDLPTLSGTTRVRPLLRSLLTDQVAAVALSRHLLARHLAVHPAVARLARHVQRGERAQVRRLQRWLARDLGGPWPQGTGPRMMGR